MNLRVFLSECPDALRFDFQQFGVDLDDLYCGRMSLLKAADLAFNLPPGSAVWRFLGGPQSWTVQEHLSALIEHNTRILWWMKTKDGGKGSNSPKAVEPPKSRIADEVSESKAKAAIARRKARVQN